MQCPRCQHENPTGTNFRGECAVPLAAMFREMGMRFSLEKAGAEMKEPA
jgi:hypothetical protein